jgi:hypothetical protein
MSLSHRQHQDFRKKKQEKHQVSIQGLKTNNRTILENKIGVLDKRLTDVQENTLDVILKSNPIIFSFKTKTPVQNRIGVFVLQKNIREKNYVPGFLSKKPWAIHSIIT